MFTAKFFLNISIVFFSILFGITLLSAPPAYAQTPNLNDCTLGGVGVCDSAFGSQPPGKEICRQRTDGKSVCSQVGSAEFPYYQCCSPLISTPPQCTTDTDCADGNPCTVDYCLGSGSPGSICVHNTASAGTVCQYNSANFQPQLCCDALGGWI